MLQGWLPPTWAVLGGILAILRISLFSYWINSYTGGGVISGLGGALVLGALPRLTKAGHFRYGLLMAAGIVVLALTRPYEGFLLCLPVAIAVGRRTFWGKNRLATPVLSPAGRYASADHRSGRRMVKLLRLPRIRKSLNIAVHPSIAPHTL